MPAISPQALQSTAIAKESEAAGLRNQASAQQAMATETARQQFESIALQQTKIATQLLASSGADQAEANRLSLEMMRASLTGTLQAVQASQISYQLMISNQMQTLSTTTAISAAMSARTISQIEQESLDGWVSVGLGLAVKIGGVFLAFLACLVVIEHFRRKTSVTTVGDAIVTVSSSPWSSDVYVECINMPEQGLLPAPRPEDAGDTTSIAYSAGGVRRPPLFTTEERAREAGLEEARNRLLELLNLALLDQRENGTPSNEIAGFRALTEAAKRIGRQGIGGGRWTGDTNILLWAGCVTKGEKTLVTQQYGTVIELYRAIVDRSVRPSPHSPDASPPGPEKSPGTEQNTANWNGRNVPEQRGDHE